MQLTDFQKNVLTLSVFGGIAYLIFDRYFKNKSEVTDSQLDKFLADNNLKKSTYDKVFAFSGFVCDPNFLVYPNEIASLINTMDPEELEDFHFIYNTFFKNQRCANLSPRELLESEWGNYYASTEQYLFDNGY